MKRRTSSEKVKVWDAFLRPPEQGEWLVRRELKKAHDYYNALLCLSLDQRNMYRAARGAVEETLPALDQERSKLSEQIMVATQSLTIMRGKTRMRVADPATEEQIKALKAELRAVMERIRQARAEVEKIYGAGDKEFKRRTAEKAAGSTAPRVRARTNPATLEEMMTEPQWVADWKLKARIEFEANEAKKRLLAECGLTPGTYLLIQKAVEAALAPPPPGQPRRPDPSPKDRFLGEGRLGVQVRKLPVADLLTGANSQLALRMSERPPSWSRLDATIRGSSRLAHRKDRPNAEQRYGTLRMRITTDNEFVEFPVKLHRPLPADGVITQIWIRAERRGPRTLYILQCVVESPQWATAGPTKGAGTVAVDTGWRVMEDGLRVAYWMDTHGRHGQVLVPDNIRKAIDYADALRSKADKHFDAARKELRIWMDANPAHVPAWMPEATETISQWHAHWRLMRVARGLILSPDWFHELWQQWLIDRKATNLDLFGSLADVSAWLDGKYSTVPPLMQIAVYLEWWRRKDAHIYDWETRERRYAQNARTDMFRKVCQLAQQYEHVLIEQIDLPKFNRNAPPEDKPNQEWLHRNGSIASPGDLAARLMETCAGRAKKVPAGVNTCMCHRCGHVNDAWGHPERRLQTCAGCGAEWDRDENACRNILALWHSPDSERSGAGQTPEPARGPEKPPGPSRQTASRAPADAPETGRCEDRSHNGRYVSGSTTVLG